MTAINNTVNDFLSGKILLINKPIRWTSFDVVKKIRTTLKKKFNLKKIKVGHAGTLDPLETGLLIVCTVKLYISLVWVGNLAIAIWLFCDHFKIRSRFRYYESCKLGYSCHGKHTKLNKLN